IPEIPETQEKTKYQSKLSMTDIIALIAIIVSIGSVLFTSQQASYQHDLSLMPFISIDSRYDLLTEDEGEQTLTISWRMENSGLGPALVQQSVVEVGDNKYVMGSDEAFDSIIYDLEKTLGMRAISHEVDPVSCPYAIEKENDWNLYSFSFKGSNTDIANVHMGLCYCSLNGECYYEGTKEGLLKCPEEVDAKDLIRGKSCGNYS
ncbi:hypothetical protein, partial [Vibrio lentus]